MLKLVIATTNQGKVQEIIQLFRMHKLDGFQVQSLQGFSIEECDEPFDTFMDNAKHKAQYYAQETNCITLADDSGLCIHGLDGFPGVKTKDFLEACGGSEAAFQTLQKKMEGATDHQASFHTALVLYFPKDKSFITTKGQVCGCITFPPRGKEGFGFDPIFIPEGFESTYAELGVHIKNQHSHRAQALQKLVAKLQCLQT